MISNTFRKLIPQNSQIRRRLRYAVRRMNFGVSSDLRNNFIQLTDKDIKELLTVLEEHYLTNESNAQNLDAHLFFRTDMDRYETVPWINNAVQLKDAKILEIGCGTGSSTVALAEQGAQVTGMDLHAESLEVAKVRCRLYGFPEIPLICANAKDLAEVFKGEKFYFIIFFATLEHMTIEERKASLLAAWNLLEDDGYICITETPNRLWFYDSHTAWAPFFNWLPDELALEYSVYSPRVPFNKQFRDNNPDSMLEFLRCGRGMSFHELDLALGKESRYTVVSDMSSYLAWRNPAKLLKRIISGDGRRERLLNSYAPTRHRAFFKENLDVILRKH